MYSIRFFNEEKDMEDCILCFYEGFFKTALDENIKRILKDYTRLLIYKSNFCMVAMYENKVVGFVTGEFNPNFNSSLAKKTIGRVNSFSYFKLFIKFYLGLYHLPPAFNKEMRLFMKASMSPPETGLYDSDCELAVLTSRRDYRKGLGTAMVDSFLDFCREVKVKKVRLYTNTLSSYQFYGKYGFTQVGRRGFRYKNYLGESYIYEYRLT